MESDTMVRKAETTMDEPAVHGYCYFYQVEGMFNGEIKYDHKRYIRFDRGMAFEYGAWRNKYELLGLAKAVFLPDTAKTMDSWAWNADDTILAHAGHVVIIWEGEWNPLEKMGFSTACIAPGRFPVVAKEIMEHFERRV